MFDTVLVANRGEIAVRVIRTLHRLGVRSVAVHSDADAGARHVREADTSVRIGPAAAAESYLRAERLIEAALRTGAQAVHPGYGFLAENPAFARSCADAGLVFVGPPAGAVELMGDKIRAKAAVHEAGVPVVPGSTASGLTDAELADAAREIGFPEHPVLLKPSAGGGGKGMRLVREAGALAEKISAARREARGAFGDDTLLVERWIDRPRHIEIQVLADTHGTVLHLGERECSLQRRHQKVIEECPSVLLDDEVRAAMGEAAVRAARSCGYVGAGTVEFIVPGADPAAFCFMEMNTRLQVEHPVTELVTGLDLVEWQLRVASGERLTFGQPDVAFRGHAVEARICAETPRVNGGRVDFLPSAGRVLALREPTGPDVRVDSGLSPGTEVGTAYDPMLAKVIAHGPDRATALRALRAALAGTAVLGVDTNTGFLRRLLGHPAVRSGDLDTGLIDRDAAALVPAGVPAEVWAAAALLRREAARPVPDDAGWVDPFSVPSGWRLGADPAWTVHPLRVTGQEPVTLRLRPAPGCRAPGDLLEVRFGEAEPVPVRLVEWAAGEPGRLVVEFGGVTTGFDWAAAPTPGAFWLGRDGDAWLVAPFDPVEAALRAAGAGGGADTLTAPMPGTVTVVKAAAGDAVRAGQGLLVVEAMKMEHVITAPHDGTVASVEVAPGAAVAMDQVLAVVTPAPAAPSGTAPSGAAPTEATR
jgi:acetyl-CoA/propionyl-CoA carboxylase biotin carboxyl carrier protein